MSTFTSLCCVCARPLLLFLHEKRNKTARYSLSDAPIKPSKSQQVRPHRNVYVCRTVVFMVVCVYGQHNRTAQQETKQRETVDTHCASFVLLILFALQSIQARSPSSFARCFSRFLIRNSPPILALCRIRIKGPHRLTVRCYSIYRSGMMGA